MPVTPSYHIYACGDQAITIELAERIDPVVNQKVISLYHYLQEQHLPGVKDIIPAYHTLTIIYDLLFLKKQYPLVNIFEKMQQQLQEACIAVKMLAEPVSRKVSVPVCYDLSLAPDLTSLAGLHELSVDDVIRLHTAKTYRVYMIGFLPGFAYMGTVDEKINTARKPQPRKSVPAGSVGIAGEQTGIYPFNSPGGWQLIGQTPVKMFTITEASPCYLQPGDDVNFYSISLSEFKKLKKA